MLVIFEKYYSSRMHQIKRLLLFIYVLPLLGFGIYHEFYVSVTDINYSEENKSIQMISRYFVDDMEKLLKERYRISPKLMSKNELDNANFYIEKYLHDKFIVSVNGEPTDFKFIGKEYDVDVMKCYLEIPNLKLKKIADISVQSRVLFDIFPEQQNIVHMNFNDEQKSFMLVKENDKAMLKL